MDLRQLMRARLGAPAAGLACLWLVACGEDPAPNQPDAATIVDVLGDTSSSDAMGEVSDDVTADAVPLACPPTQAEAPVDPKRRKFAMSLFHYNVEYVVGGLEVVGKDGKKVRLFDNPVNAGWDLAKTEDYIIDQTLRPILEMYDKHPTWGVDIELQAYMVEVMAERHPKTLDLLRKLAVRHQVELVSFHYAAQLFLAFPGDDQRRSLQRTREVFAKHCLPLSGVVFNQEGQAGEGRQKVLVQEGYTTGIFPKNLWRYQYKDANQWWPWYESEGGTLIVGPGGTEPASGIDVAWNFLDDGELRAAPVTSTGDPLNPYFGPTAPADPKRVAEFEAELAATEAQGYHMARVSDYVRHLQAIGVEKKKAPPLLDGTWQAPSTQSLRKWMGGLGILGPLDEVDNDVRAGNLRARADLLAVEVLGKVLQKQGKALAGLDAAVKGMWHDLWHAEVSDCSGINPWVGEVWYGLNQNAKIQAEAAIWRGKALQALGTPHVRVDLQAQTAQAIAQLTPEAGKPVDAPLPVTITTDRATQVQWRELAANHWELRVEIAADCDDCQNRAIEVHFPRNQDAIEVSPGLLDDEVRTYPLAGFHLLDGEVWLALPNGLIGLGNGWYVLKDTRWTHVAARISPKAPTIEFRDSTLTTAKTVWRFEIVKGTQPQALERAIRLNVWPTVEY